MLLNRAQLDARCRKLAQERQQDTLLIRRRIVFERLLERLSTATGGQWMLKGGMALAYRWGGRGRETRDMDVAFLRAEQTMEKGDFLRERLEAVCAVGLDDGFELEVLAVRESRAEMLAIEGHTVSVRSTYLGHPFETITVDATVDRTFSIPPQAVIVASMLPERAGVEVWLTAPEQQFAEKLHAMTRVYGEARIPSTRLRDLVDIVALIQRGLLNPETTRQAAREVFAARGTHDLPVVITAPAQWERAFSMYGEAYGLGGMSLDEGMRISQQFWASLGLP